MGKTELIRTYGSLSLCVRGATPFPWMRLDLLTLCIPGINNVSRTIHAEEQDQHREEKRIETELHSALSLPADAFRICIVRRRTRCFMIARVLPCEYFPAQQSLRLLRL